MGDPGKLPRCTTIWVRFWKMKVIWINIGKINGSNHKDLYYQHITVHEQKRLVRLGHWEYRKWSWKHKGDQGEAGLNTKLRSTDLIKPGMESYHSFGFQPWLPLESPVEPKKYQCLGPTPKDSTLVVLECDLSIRTFESFPGDSNVSQGALKEFEDRSDVIRYQFSLCKASK